ncbi:hypothetical protein [Amycolatopsis sp. NPDC052450]
MTSINPRRGSRWTRLVLMAAAVRGTCAGAARAVADYLIDLF